MAYSPANRRSRLTSKHLTGRRPAATRLGAKLALGLLLAAGVGCGFADPGDGTKTVEIKGSLRCSYPDLTTYTTWQLNDAVGPLLGANVTLIDADSGENIEVPAGAEPGQYKTVWPGYHRRVKAHIWRGKDGARFSLEGPAPHVVTSPMAGTMVPGKAPLTVGWLSPDGLRADRIDVAVDPDGGEPGAPQMQTFGGTMSKDSGKAKLALTDVRAGPHALEVARTTALTPAGGRAGSEVVHTYAVQTAFYRLTVDK